MNSCRTLARCIIGAGGASLLEVQLCPYVAMLRLGSDPDDPTLADIRTKVGIIGFEDGSVG